MIYAFLGETCSGKSTAFQKLLELGYETTISYTTRPKRPNEADGKEYLFISKEEFKSLDNQGLVVAPRVYNDWYYGMNLLSIEPNLKQIVIVDPKGYRDLVKALGENNVTGIHFNASFEDRLFRGLDRKDDINELFRRLEEDEKDFVGIEDEVDFVIPSTYKDEVIERLLSIIEGRS